jgi:hypothetical protein
MSHGSEAAGPESVPLDPELLELPVEPELSELLDELEPPDLPPAPELPELPEVLVLDAEEDPLVVPDSPASAKEFAGWFVLEVHAGSTAVAARMHRETFDNCSMTIEPRSFVSRVT